MAEDLAAGAGRTPAPDYGEIIVWEEARQVARRRIVARNEPLTIGQNPDQWLILSERTVSRRHADIQVSRDGSVLLTDLGSTNGTFQLVERDGMRVRQKMRPNEPVRLSDGMRFSIGTFQLLYSAVSEPYLQSPSSDSPNAALQGGGTVAARGGQNDAPPRSTAGSISEARALEAVYVPDNDSADLQIAADAGLTLRRALKRQLEDPDLPPTTPSRYMRYLPPIFQPDSFIGRYLKIFETLWEPLEQRQDHTDMYFAPYTCPESFLPWLAGWIYLPLDPHWPERRRRRVLARGLHQFHVRGTHAGLQETILDRTGLTAEISDVPDTPFLFRVRIDIPAGSARARDAGDPLPTREDLIDLINEHKPAYSSYFLEITGAEGKSK